MKLSQSAQAWLVAMTASLFFFFVFIQWTMFNALSPSLATHFGVSASDVSHLSVIYFYTNIVCLLPAGIILDHCSTRKVIVLALLAACVGTLGLVLAPSFFLASCCRVLVGIAGSFGLISCVRLASRWFSDSSLAFVIGVIVMVAMMGGVVAQTPFTLLTDHFGWQATVYVDAFLGLLIMLLVMVIVRDEPKEPMPGILPHNDAKLPFLQAIKATVVNPQNWYAGLYTSLMNLPIMVFSFWGSFYFVQYWHLSRMAASWVDTALLLGAIVGSPALGWLSDRMRGRRRPMMMCALIMVALSFVLYVAHTMSLGMLVVFFAVLGFFSSGQVIGYPLVAESNPSDLTATAEGFASILIMVGGLSQQWFGDLLDCYGKHSIVHHVTHYSHASYHTAILMFPLAFVLAWVMAFFAKDHVVQE